MTTAFEAAGFGIGSDGRVEPYRNTRASIARVAELVREARLDPDIRGWAIDRLREAGFDGRAATASPVQVAQIILDAVRRVTTYVPDQAGAEWIQKPRVTLCLPGNKCIRGGDCDDLVALGCSLLLALGLAASLVRQELGAGAQEHVLVGVLDPATGQKFYVDFANTMTPVYEGSRAKKEWWTDPLDAVSPTTGTAGADFVTLAGLGGRMPLNRRPLVQPAIRPNPQLSPLPGLGAVGLGLTGVSDVDQLDQQVQADMTALQTAVSACSALSPSDTQAFAGFAAGWKTLHDHWIFVKTNLCQSVGPGNIAACLIALPSIADDMRGYATQIQVWQQRVKLACPNYNPPPGIVVPVPAPEPPDTASTVEKAAKAVGAVIVTGVVAYGVFKGVEVLAPWFMRKRAAASR